MSYSQGLRSLNTAKKEHDQCRKHQGEELKKASYQDHKTQHQSRPRRMKQKLNNVHPTESRVVPYSGRIQVGRQRGGTGRERKEGGNGSRKKEEKQKEAEEQEDE